MSAPTYKNVRQWTNEKRIKFTELASQDPMYPTPDSNQPPIDPGATPTATYAIIGAGLTGCSVAHTMLRHKFFENDTIVVLEARDVASGASGITHGQVAPATAMDWGELVRTVGVRNANQAVALSHKSLVRLAEVVSCLRVEDKEKVQFRPVKIVTNLMTPEARALYRRWGPPFQKMFAHLGTQFTEKDAGEAGTTYRFRIPSTWGAVEGLGATLNPQAFVIALFNEMVRENEERFSVQTHTAVQDIEYNSANVQFPYLVRTNRGFVRVSSVIHCCNGQAAHLNFRLRGKLFPLNHPMSVQGLAPVPPDNSNEYAWRLVQRPTVDYQTGTFTPGQYSVVQDGPSHAYYVAGGPQTVPGLIPMSGEDALQLSKNDHRERIHRLFRQPVERLQDWVDLATSSADEPSDGTYRADCQSLLSKCVGYTADLRPLVGVIPVPNAYERNNRQWIAAGCNGRGLDKCWVMGEGLVAMIAGEFVEHRLPECYHINRDRLNTMHAPDFLNRLLQVAAYEDRTPVEDYLTAN